MRLPESVKGWVFAAVGVLFLLAAAVLFVAMYYRAESMTVAEGTVTGTYSGHPEIEFVAANGQRVEFSESAATGYAIGDKVRVLYNPEDPERGPSIDTVRVYYFTPMMVAILGAGFLVVGLWIARAHRRKPPTDVA